MKRIISAVFALAVVITFAGESPTIQNIAARQRWPWSSKVDIDFTLVSETACDIEVSATWQGQNDPVRLDPAVEESLVSLSPGVHRICWDPVKAGYGDKDLVGFKVAVVPRTFEERLYLVVDIINGTYEYLAAPPEGGWKANPYKSTKMVFRRIPAGTYVLGHDTEAMKPYIGNANETRINQTMYKRSGTWTSDFYMGIFPVTIAQMVAISSGEVNNSPNYLLPQTATYSSLRGIVADGINWPSTKFKVKADSYIGKFRSRIHNALVIDLPTDIQWEIAARAGTETFYPNGGAAGDSEDVLNGILDRIAWTTRTNGGAHKEVGTKEQNAWGLYDVVGSCNNWVLDAQRQWSCNDHYPEWDEFAYGTDQVGRDMSTYADNYIYRVRRGTAWDSSPLVRTFVGLRTAYSTTAPSAVRLCIHLKPPASFNGEWFPAE